MMENSIVVYSKKTARSQRKLISVYILLVTLLLYHRIDCDGEKLERVSIQMDSNEVKASPHSNSPELDSIIEDVESSLSSLKGHRK